MNCKFVLHCYFIFDYNKNLLLIKVRHYLHHWWPDFSFSFPTQLPKKTVIFVSTRFKELTEHRQRTRESTVLSMDVTFFTTTNGYLMCLILATILDSLTTNYVNWKCMVSNAGLYGKSIFSSCMKTLSLWFHLICIRSFVCVCLYYLFVFLSIFGKISVAFLNYQIRLQMF